MKRLLRENGLSIVWLGLFFLSFIFGQIVFGRLTYNKDQRDHRRPEAGVAEYLTTPHFVEATMENWESEFLQMFLFIALTSFLYQKGSAESKKIDEEEAVDRDPALSKHKSDAPYPVRRGGVLLSLYKYSLSLAFLTLFFICFFLHAAGGARDYNDEQREHGSVERVTMLEYMGTSRFWFESFQNWQSEFLAVGLMVVLTIWLRQQGSPESKPVDAPHSQTGKD
jgi:TM2 domain-containing membrane protein YozV